MCVCVCVCISPLLMNVYKREVKGKELPRAAAEKIAAASNRFAPCVCVCVFVCVCVCVCSR